MAITSTTRRRVPDLTHGVAAALVLPAVAAISIGGGTHLASSPVRDERTVSRGWDSWALDRDMSRIFSEVNWALRRVREATIPWHELVYADGPADVAYDDVAWEVMSAEVTRLRAPYLEDDFESWS